MTNILLFIIVVLLICIVYLLIRIHPDKKISSKLEKIFPKQAKIIETKSEIEKEIDNLINQNG